MLQIQDQSLRPLTTAHLAQTMSLLVLSNLELQHKVLEELSQNPALELVEQRVCPTCRRILPGQSPCPVCSYQSPNEEAIVFLSPRDSFQPSVVRSTFEEPLEQDPAAPEDLELHILQQLASDLEPEERQLAAYILASLDEDGFLQDGPAQIAKHTHSTLSTVHRVIDLIAHADPPGLATSGPRQALLVQIEVLNPDCQPGSLPDLARQIIQSHFEQLARHEFSHISHALQISQRGARQAAAFIQDKLNPYPARSFWESGRQPQTPQSTVYYTPDIQITKKETDDGDRLIVEIFAPVSGWLRINPLFRRAMSQANHNKSHEWSAHLERASLFVKCLQQRNNTMRRLMQLLVRCQRDFILHGDRCLIPMTRAQVSEELEVHESTISRAVANKSIALPDGRIIPLSRFFDRSLPVRDRIKEIIAHEKDALTDQQISRLLKKEGYKVARRTVAKYRAMENILPARLRNSMAT